MQGRVRWIFFFKLFSCNFPSSSLLSSAKLSNSAVIRGGPPHEGLFTFLAFCCYLDKESASKCTCRHCALIYSRKSPPTAARFSAKTTDFFPVRSALVRKAENPGCYKSNITSGLWAAHIADKREIYNPQVWWTNTKRQSPQSAKLTCATVNCSPWKVSKSQTFCTEKPH